jgi:predicted RecB family nuclease
MSDFYSAAVIVFAVLIAILWIWKSGRRTFPPKGHRVHLKEIQISCEAFFEATGKVFLVGKPDLVTIDLGDMLHIFEYKTRKNEVVYLADKVQLALYKFILEKTQGLRVSNVAHIVFVGNGSREKMVPVSLATVDVPAQVAGYVRDTRKDPGCTMNGKCRHCQFLGACKHNPLREAAASAAA